MAEREQSDPRERESYVEGNGESLAHGVGTGGGQNGADGPDWPGETGPSEIRNRPGAGGREELQEQVEQKVARRLRARRTRQQGVWFGLGMFGLVGWTVAIFTILGIVLGSWLDRRWPSSFSWVLTLLFVGLMVGLLNAWRWIKQESLPESCEEDKEATD